VSPRLTASCLAALLGAAGAGSALADRGKSGPVRSAVSSVHARSAPSAHHFQHHRGARFHGHAFIAGAIVAPVFYYPGPYYPAPYYAPPPPAGYWYYCPAYGAYYPYVASCPSGWQLVAPH
jgi:hypothetical protein